MRKVRNGCRYVFVPVGMDRWDPKTYGNVKEGDVVTVKSLPGCPPANTMGHCHIEKDGEFAGLVLTNSLQPVGKVAQK